MLIDEAPKKGTPMGQIVLQVVPGASVQALEFIQTPSGQTRMAGSPLLKVRLTERAEDGRANMALIRWLSELSGLPVHLARGHTSRRKTVAFDATEEEFLSALRTGLDESRK